MSRVLVALLFVLSLSAREPAVLSVSAAARSIQPGELVVLTIATTGAVDAIRARAFAHDLAPFKIDADHWRVLVGIDLDATVGTHPVTIEAHGAPGGVPANTTYDLIVVAKTFPTRTLTVDDAFVNPPASVTARIEKDAADLDHAWNSSAAERLWSTPFVRPVAEAANSAFGSRSVFNGQPKSPHGGADFLSPAGTPIKAPNAGRVLIARDLYYTGNTVVIDHGLGLLSLLAHMSVIGVHEGDIVTPGQIVGRVGATGRVTGPHLHWTVRLTGARIDPLSVLALLGA